MLIQQILLYQQYQLDLLNLHEVNAFGLHKILIILAAPQQTQTSLVCAAQNFDNFGGASANSNKFGLRSACTKFGYLLQKH